MKKGDIIQNKLKPELKAQVNWVVEGDAGITYLEPPDWKNGANQVLVEEWSILQESQATFQSSVEQMGVEELRANIERLRGLRMQSVKSKPSKREVHVTIKADPTASLLAHLSPEKIAELKKKLGIA